MSWLDRVDADHHLDGVVAEPGRQLERRAPSTRGRPTRWTARRGGASVIDRRSTGHRVDQVEALEDDALAQRPRADLELGQVEDVHDRVGDERAGDELVRRGSARRRAGRRARRARHRHQLRDPLRRTRASRTRRTSGPFAGRSRTADPRQRAERLGRRDGVVRRPGPEHGAGVAGDVGADAACAASREPSLVGAASPGTRGSAGRAERQRLRHVGRLVGTRRRSPASHRRCRRRARRPSDQPNQRRTARKVSRASSSPGSTSMSTPVASPDPVEHVVAVGRVTDRRRREAEDLLAALVLGDDERAEATNSVSARRPARRRAPSASRCSASRSGSLNENAGSGAAPPVRVDHEQVPGVGADVEDAQPA